MSKTTLNRIGVAILVVLTTIFGAIARHQSNVATYWRTTYDAEKVQHTKDNAENEALIERQIEANHRAQAKLAEAQSTMDTALIELTSCAIRNKKPVVINQKPGTAIAPPCLIKVANQ